MPAEEYPGGAISKGMILAQQPGISAPLGEAIDIVVFFKLLFYKILMRIWAEGGRLAGWRGRGGPTRQGLAKVHA